VRRSERNPILTRADIPGRDVSSVFNPGAVRRGGRDRLLLRVQTRGRETLWMTAERRGDAFTVRPEPVRLDLPDGIHHAYDARLTALGDTVYAVFAADTDDGCRLGIARTTDLERFDLIGLDAAGDRRNGVLFPERFGEHYLRLERPNVVQPRGGPPTGSEIVLARSKDLVSWEPLGPVMQGRPRRWDEIIGSGPPPLKTREGWLHLYHGVATHFASANIYQAGVVLLDLADPRRVLGRSRENVLEPREPYELTGQVPNVVFPTGWIADEEGRIDVYYGAADTVVGLATTTVQELLDAL
jgi:beta-1,4-mannooligosaccharide/beta-1,4-mannosyl-N-acetylglucosamine phosphorylase